MYLIYPKNGEKSIPQKKILNKNPGLKVSSWSPEADPLPLAASVAGVSPETRAVPKGLLPWSGKVLMEEIRLTGWDGKKYPIKNTGSYTSQVVQEFYHQQYHTEVY